MEKDGKHRSISKDGDVIIDNVESDAQKENEEGRDGQHTISNFAAITHILKGNIGIGILTLPRAIMNAGLFSGIVGLVCIGFVCVYCMRMLVRAAHKAMKTRPDIKFIDYAETAEAAFRDAGGRWEKCALSIRRLLNTFLCANQISSNAVYVLFIAQNIRPLIIHYGGSTMQALNYRYYILMVLPFILALCMVRNLKYLSPCSTIANVIQSAGLGIIFYYIFRGELKSSSSLPWFGTLNRLPLFFGTAIFAIEGISVVLPIENEMRYPQDMLGKTGVLNTSMTLVVVLYVAMGFFGYLKYGDDIDASITLNLPAQEIAGQITLCLFSIAIFFSYALQFYVVIEIIKRNILNGWSARWLNIADYLTRIIINLATFALAATVPWLDLFVALIGAVKMSTLSLMAPAIIDTASNWHELGRCNWKMAKNGIIFLFGLFGCIVGTMVSLQHIVENFINDKIIQQN